MFRSVVLLSIAVGVRCLKAPAVPAMTVPRVVLSPLPIVYVYDHCPFCVRVRLALGLKNVKHEVRFLANDDVATPTALIGKKAVPIFQMVNEYVMPESLDIIAKVDSDPRFGKTGFFKPMSGREDIKAWQAKVADTNRFLQRPRYMMSSILPEFQQVEGKNAFVKNHPVPVRVAWDAHVNTHTHPSLPRRCCCWVVWTRP
jgi:glutaredoxin 2